MPDQEHTRTRDPDRLRVVAAIIVSAGEVLACRRNPERSAGGLWEFPGGKIELGESPQSALRREIHEELNTAIEVGDQVTIDVTIVEGRAIELTCFRAYLLSTRPSRSTDHDQLIWISPSELERLTWAAPDIPAVRVLVAEARES
ncbi:(deoxy)nucleoside triphosphate pyrophosphohydrolase [Leucobacter sp. HNU]|uniref:(deoxy)nucleoside triphosphate pyrophosphohydrolase n=1 Tax=Leucobacter sp. HNU TaxID=3236805 RepID=UPI003A804C9D